jgi:hypothetical protein
LISELVSRLISKIRRNKRPTSKGVKVVGTPEAIGEEIAAAVTRTRGSEGQQLRRNVEDMSRSMGPNGYRMEL